MKPIKIAIVLMGLTYIQLAQATFFKNLESILIMDIRPEASSFLQDIKSSCIGMSSIQDRSTYFDFSEGNPRQSARSLQSRMCATIIDQHDETINTIKTNMGTCDKFGNLETKSCCEKLDRAYKNTDTKQLVVQLCKDVPSHFDLMKKVLGQKSSASCSADPEKNQAGSWWSIFSILNF